MSVCIPLMHFHVLRYYQAHLAYRHAHLDYLRRRKSQQNLDTNNKQENYQQNLRNGYSETNLYENSNRIFAPPVTPTKQSRPSPVKLCNFMHEFTVSEPNFGSLPARIHAM